MRLAPRNPAGEASEGRDQSAGYARRSHSHAIADVGSIPTVSTDNCLRVPTRSQLLAAVRSAMSEARRRLEVAVQNQRVEIRTIGPHDRSQLVIHANLSKEVRVSKWIKHRAVQLACEIDVSRAAVAEADPQPVVPKHLRGRNPYEVHRLILRQRVDRLRVAAARIQSASSSPRGPSLRSVRCYLTSMRTTISTKGQIVLPAELRAEDEIKAGEEFEVDRIGPDEYRLTRLTPPPNRGLVDWLRSCPEDGWFVGIESESTDSL